MKQSAVHSEHPTSDFEFGNRPSLEPGELSQWLCHDDSTINIVVLIIIIIIIITSRSKFWKWRCRVKELVGCRERSEQKFFVNITFCEVRGI